MPRKKKKPSQKTKDEFRKIFGCHLDAFLLHYRAMGDIFDHQKFEREVIEPDPDYDPDLCIDDIIRNMYGEEGCLILDKIVDRLW